MAPAAVRTKTSNGNKNLLKRANATKDKKHAHSEETQKPFELPENLDAIEEVLSSSLVLELGGGDTGEVLLTAGKKRRKERNDVVSDEIVQEAKKISKTEKKRIEQIRLRKDKEEKRDQYLNLLNQHVLPESHRQLLTSSKNFGQSATLKGALKKALKRHKAGLSITAEEHELLFPQNAQQV
jgi:hypothetical protein